MSAPDTLVTLSECIFRVASHTGEWPEFAKARSTVLAAATDGRVTIYGAPKFLHQHEPVPPYAFSKPLRLPSLELLSIVKNLNSTRFGDWGTGKDDDKLGTMWRRLCMIETQVDSLVSSLKARRERRIRSSSQTSTKSGRVTSNTEFRTSSVK